MFFNRNLISTLLILSLFIIDCKRNSYPDNDITSVEGSYDIERINTVSETISNVPGMKSLMVSYKGELISENYFNGTTEEPDSILDVRSVTKSITSILTGIAIEKGYIESVDQTLWQLIPDIIINADRQFRAITIKDLLTMRAGFEWHEINETSEFGAWVSSPDQLEYIFSREFSNAVGTTFDYSDGAAHLMSVVLAEKAGMSTLQFAKENLFNPLDIGERFWYEDNRGYNYGGVGLIITPLDMIKIGELMLNHGVYNGTRIVSENWCNESTSVQTSTNNSVPYGPTYGYYWWVGSNNGHNFYFANGYGGQFIVVVEELNLVVTAHRDFLVDGSNAGNHWYTILNTIVTEIIPAFN